MINFKSEEQIAKENIEEWKIIENEKSDDWSKERKKQVCIEKMTDAVERDTISLNEIENNVLKQKIIENQIEREKEKLKIAIGLLGKAEETMKLEFLPEEAGIDLEKIKKFVEERKTSLAKKDLLLLQKTNIAFPKVKTNITRIRKFSNKIEDFWIKMSIGANQFEKLVIKAKENQVKELYTNFKSNCDKNIGWAEQDYFNISLIVETTDWDVSSKRKKKEIKTLFSILQKQMAEKYINYLLELSGKENQGFWFSYSDVEAIISKIRIIVKEKMVSWDDLQTNETKLKEIAKKIFANHAKELFKGLNSDQDGYQKKRRIEKIQELISTGAITWEELNKIDKELAEIIK